MQFDTVLDLGTGISIPLRAGLGYTESWVEVAPPTYRHTSRGRAVVLKQWFKRKYAISIAASGPGVWRMPAFDGIEAGTELLLDSGREMTAQIPAGTKQCILSRVHVPGSVRVVKAVSADDEDIITHTEHAGRIIRVGANAPETYQVLWRPRAAVLFVAVSFDADPIAGGGSWNLEVVEKDAPL